MTELDYLKDCYMKEMDATILSVKDGKYIVLDRTIFYPNSGGQPSDTGRFIRGEEVFNVVYAAKFDDDISHEVDREGLCVGDKIRIQIDWDKRYRLMRMHTAAHVLSRVMFDETGAHTSGNQLGYDSSRIDFTLDSFEKDKIPGWVEKANAIIQKGSQVKKSFMARDDALKIQGFAGPSPHLMKGFDTLRVVDISGVDAQPCGGTHLDDIKDIGKIVYLKAENKGKSNRRIYFTLES